MEVNLKPKKHLINIIKDTRDHHPNFTLFLGAGASVTCGVKASKEMITEWRQKYKNLDATYNEIEKNHWFGRPEEYSVLFEKLYDQPSQRREYIETCLKKAKPSWGYIYLVNLIGKDVFNTIFTTNFDDLLNEACYLFSSNVRPLVCAHDSSVRSLRLTSHRPKIIKLHGDFLFDDIKNTTRELESLETNMREKFRQYAPEYGMIVVGYAGNDRSVMDNINTLLRSDNNYPHGIYWCVRDVKEISDAVKNLCRFPNFYLVSIEGFDELFAEINDALELTLQPEMTDPYNAVSERLNALLGNVGIPDDPDKMHPIIKRDVESLANRIKGRSSVKEQIGQPKTYLIQAEGLSTNPPYQLLAEAAFRSGVYGEAKDFIKLQIENEPNSSAYRLAIKIIKRDQDADFARFIYESIKKACSSFDFDSCNSIAVDLISIGEYDIANEVLDIAGNEIKKKPYPSYCEDFFVINKAQIKKHKNELLSANEIDELKQILKNSDEITQMGCHIVLDDFDEAFSIFQEEGKEYMMEWPILKLFPESYLEKIKAKFS